MSLGDGWLWKRQNWGPSCGEFIPPFVDVMIPNGPAYVWLQLVLEEDLTVERCGDEVWGVDPPDPEPHPEDPALLIPFWDFLKFGAPSKDHEWLQEEISQIGWESLLDLCDYNRRTEDGHHFEVIQWALECGIAPEQPFLVRIDIPYGYRCSYEYDEWETDYNYEIISVQPLSTKETAKRWKKVVKAMADDRKATETPVENMDCRNYPV